MTRTNIDIDDDLVASVMQRYGLRTKKEAVDLALRRAVGPVPTRDEMADDLGVSRSTVQRKLREIGADPSALDV